MYYNVDDIKTNMKKDLAKAKAFCAAWQAVTFPTKKDGKPFSNMSKNISGAKYTMEQYAMQDGEYELLEDDILEQIAMRKHLLFNFNLGSRRLHLLWQVNVEVN